MPLRFTGTSAYGGAKSVSMRYYTTNRRVCQGKKHSAENNYCEKCGKSRKEEQADCDPDEEFYQEIGHGITSV